MDAITVGQKIRKARRDKDLTQEELAKKLGTTKATINRYESGVISNIPRSKIEALAQALDLQPSDLFTYEETLDMYRKQMDEARKEIAELEADIEEQRRAGRELEDVTRALDTLNSMKADLADKVKRFEELFQHQYQVFLSYANPKDVSPGLAELEARLSGPGNNVEASAPETPAAAVPAELADEEKELLRIYKKLSVRRRMQLLGQAYALEDEEG